MQGKCVMKGRREESMLSNCLSGLLEILGRDKVTRFVSDHETGQNSRKTPTLARRGEPLGTMALPWVPRNPPVGEGESGCG